MDDIALFTVDDETNNDGIKLEKQNKKQNPNPFVHLNQDMKI